MTRDQGEAILAELKRIRELLEKPEAIKVSDVALARENVQMSIGDKWHVIGKDDAPVTLVEFTDYQCSFCRSFHTEAFAELKKNYIDTGKVRFVSRDMPLPFHPYSMKAAEATRCAGDQGKYWEMRDVLIKNSASLNDETIAKLAKALPIKMDDFSSCLASGRYKDDIQKDSSVAATLQILATPTFVLAKSGKDTLSGVKIVGALPYSQFQAAIDQMMKN